MTGNQIGNMKGVLKLDKEQLKLSRQYLEQDKEEIRERLHLVAIQESNETVADYGFCVDMYGLDKLGNVLLIQHKASRSKDVCLEIEYSPFANGKWCLHLGKATHLAYHHIPGGKLYTFEVRLLYYVFDWARADFRLLINQANGERRKQPLAYIDLETLINLYGIEVERQTTGGLRDFTDSDLKGLEPKRTISMV